MYQIGAYFLYGMHGVCQLISTEERKVDGRSVYYYVLEPIDNAESRFLVPQHNEKALAKLRPVLDKDQLDVLLGSQDVREDGWIEDENQRKQYYRELIHSGDRTALLRMIHSLHEHKLQQESIGRKLHQCDDNFMRDAQRLLSSELSLVLDIPQDQVAEYVKRKLKD